MTRDFSFSIATNTGYSIVPLTTWISLVLFFAVLFAIYIWIKRATGTSSRSVFNQNMRVIERVSLGMDKHLLLVELSGMHYVLYTDKNGARLIDKRTDLNIEQSIAATSGDFSGILKQWLEKRTEGGNENDESQE